MAGPTAANIENTITNLSYHLTVGGVDIGLMGAKGKIKWPNKMAMQKYAHSQADYSMRDQADAFEFTGTFIEATHANLLLMLPGVTETDTGASLTHDGEFGNVTPTYDCYIIMYHGKSFFKRIHIPRASLAIDGDTDIGSDVQEFSGSFKLVGLTGGAYLYKVLHTADSSTLTATVDPTDGETGVAVDDDVIITFSQQVGSFFRQTGTGPYIRLINKSTLANAVSSVSWDTAGEVATVAHDNFTAGAEYILLIDRQIRASTGALFRGNGTTDATDKITDFTVAS